MNKQLFTINEAAKHLGVSIKTLRRWDQKGLLSAQRTIGNQRRYDIEDLERLKGKKAKSVIRKQQAVIARQVSIAEAAAFLGISVKTLRRWEQRGIISSHRSPTNQRFFVTTELNKLKTTKSEPEIIKPEAVIQPINQPSQPQKRLFTPSHPFAMPHMKFAHAVFPVLGFIMTVAALGTTLTLTHLGVPLTKIISYIPYLNTSQGVKAGSGEEVLQSSTKKRDYAFKISVPVEMLSTASVSGNLTAPNILYSVVAGDNITISGDPQNPTISTDIAILPGDGITIDPDGTVTNDDPGSAQNIFGSIKVGSTTLTAGSNTDSFELAAGSNITLSTDSSTKKITITAADQSSSGIDGIEILEGGTTIAETATTIDFLAGDFDVGESPSGEANIQLAATLTSVSGVAGSFAVGTSATIGTDLAVTGNVDIDGTLTLGSDTINDLTGVGLSISGNALGINLTTLGGAGVDNSNSGLEVGTNGLTLLKGCDEGDVLKWDDTNTIWECASDAGAGGAVGGTGAANHVAFWSDASTLTSNADFYWNNTSELLGIGTNGVPLAALDVRGSTTTGGTTSIGSFSGQSSFAGLVVDNSGSGDLFTASSSGNTRFVIAQNGNVGINKAIPTSTLDIVGTLAVSGTTNLGGIAYTWPGTDSSGQILQTDGSGTLSWIDPGNLPNSDDWDSTSGSLVQKIITQDLLLGGVSTASARFAVININSGTPTASLSAGLAGGSYLTAAGVLQTTAYQNLTLGGDSTGNISLRPKDGAGTLSLNVGTLTINGSPGITSVSPTCVSFTNGIVTGSAACGAGSGGSVWTMNTTDGTLYPINSTLDLLIGGVSTASAKFAILNVAGTTPSASLSGSTGSTFLTSSGSLETTNRQTLTLGGGNSGDVNLSIGGSNALRINGTPGATVGTASCVTTINGIVTGPDTCPSAAATFIWQTGSGSIFQGNTTQDLLIGGVSTSSAKFAFTGVDGSNNPIASISANPSSGTSTGLALNGTGTIQALNMHSLTVGGNTTGNIILDSGSNTIRLADLTTNGVVYTSGSNGTLNSETLLNVARGGTGVDGSSVTDGQLLIGNNTANGFTLATLTEGAGIQITNAGGSITIAQNPFGASKWFQNGTDGTLYPNISTLDLLIGGVSTASAKFAFINNAGGTPTASIAGNLTLDSTGSIQSTKNQTLTMGGDRTGNIILSPLNGSGTVTSTGSLNLSSGKTFQINGTDVLSATTLGSGVTGSSLTSVGALNSGSITSGFGAIDIGADNLTAGGTIIFSGLSTNGFVKTTGGTGTLSVSSTVNLSSEVSGILAVNNGGSPFEEAGGAIFERITTQDFILGSTSTGSAKFAVLNVAGGTPVATLSAGITGGSYLTASGTLQTTAYQNLTLGGDSTGNISIAPKAGTGTLALTANVLTINGSPGITSVSPTCVSFTNGIVTGSAACGAGSGGSVWTMNTTNGTLYPINSTLDLLIGGVSTASAKFAFTNVAGGTPTASISAITTNNALVLDATGNIFTTNKQTLTIGSSSTGNIVLGDTAFNSCSALETIAGVLTCGTDDSGSSGSSNWTLDTTLGVLRPNNSTVDLLIGGTSSSSARFHVFGSANLAGTTPVASISGNTSNAGLIVDNRGSGDIFAASSSGMSRFVVKQNGQIGIGTTVPSADRMLEIASPTMSVYTKFNPTTSEDWSIGADANGFSFVNDTDSGATRMVIDENGNVGIGTTDPTVGTFAKGIEIESAGTGPALTLDATLGKRFIIGSADTPAGLYFRDDTAGAYRMVIDTNGSIGIGTGTNSVLGTLDVRGNTAHQPIASLSGSTSFAGLIVDNANGDLFTASNSGLSRFTIRQNGGITSVAERLDANANVNQFDAYVTKSSGLATGTSFRTFASQTSGASSVSLFGHYNNLEYDTTSSTNHTGDLIASLNQVNWRGTGTSSTGRLIGQVGKVVTYSGAGTVENAIGLLTEGTYAGGTLTNSYGVRINNPTGASTVTNAYGLYIENTTKGATLNYPLYVAGGTSYFGGQVGIGATSPLAALDVRGLSGTTPVASVSGRTSFAAAVVDNSGVGDIFAASSSGLNRFVIKQNGNVGIGTSTPTSPLTVNASLQGGDPAAVTIIASNAAGFDNDSTIGLEIDFKKYGTCGIPLSCEYSPSGYGLYLTASSSGASNVSYLYGQRNNVTLSSNDQGGGGTPEAYGVYNSIATATDHFDADSIYGTYNNVNHKGTGHVTNLFGYVADMGFTGLSGGANTVSDVVGYQAYISAFRQTITDARGISLRVNTSTGGTITTGYGVYIENVEANNAYGIYQAGTNDRNYFAGKVGIGTSTPIASLDLQAVTSTLPVASISGSTNAGFASLVVTNSGAGDIFTASSSGLQRFTIKQNGTIQLATSHYDTCTSLATINGLLTCGSGGTTAVYNANGAAGSSSTSSSSYADMPSGTTSVSFTKTSSTSKLLITIQSGAYASGIGAEIGYGVRIDSTDYECGNFFFNAASHHHAFSCSITLTGISAGSKTAQLRWRAIAGTVQQDGNDWNSITVHEVEANTDTSLWELRSGAITQKNVTEDLLIGGTTSSSANFRVAGTTALNSIPTVDIIKTSNALVAGAQNLALRLDKNSDVTGEGIAIGFTASSTESNVGAKIVHVRTGSNSQGDLLFYTKGNTTAGDTTSEKLRITGAGTVGINWATPSAALHVTGNLADNSVAGTTPTASFSGRTSFASMVVDNTGRGDLFTASASGLTRFTIANNGNVTLKASTSGIFQIENAQGVDIVNVDSLFNNMDLLAMASGEIASTSWSNTSNLLTDHDGGTAIAANGYLYNIGGASNGSYTGANEVSYAKIYADGTIGTWRTTAPIPNNRSEHVTIVANGFIYVMGGTGTGSPSSIVYYARLNADGSVSDWRTTTALPEALMEHSGVVLGNYVYIMGGYQGSSTWSDDVYYAKLNADGTIGAWSTATTPLPEVLSNMTAVSANGFIYALGGKDGTALPGGVKNTVYYVQPDQDGNITTSWLTDTMSVALHLGSSVVSNGNIYYMGGRDSSDNYRSEVYYAKLNRDGSVGNWIGTKSLSTIRQNHASAIFNGYIYVLGGGDSGDFSYNTVYYASTSRVRIGGNLDLIGLQGQVIASSAGDLSLGTTGGSITAGNGTFVGGLQVLGNGMFNGSLSVNGGLTAYEGAIIRNSSTTTQVASISGATSATALTLDNSGSGAIFNATSNTVSRFYIGQNGYIGMGTTSPQAHLNIVDSLDAATAGDDNLSILLRRNASTVGTGPGIGFASTTSTDIVGAKIVFLRTDTNSQGDLAFYVKGDTEGSDTTRQVLKLSALGTSPIATLSGRTSFAGLVVDNPGSGDLFTASSSGVSQFVIKNGGQVGIGTTTPDTALQVNAPSIAAVHLRRIGNATGGSNIQFENGAGYLWEAGAAGSSSNSPFTIIDRTVSGGPSRFVIDTSGKVGIGNTSTLNSTFDVKAQSGTLSVASMSGRTTFATLAVDNSLGDLFTASSSGLNRFVIKNNGNVGIGTSVPDQPLTIIGNWSVKSDDAGTKGVRVRTSGSFVDFESVNDMYLSTWSGANFTGTQQQHLIFDAATPRINAFSNLDVAGRIGTEAIASLSGRTAFATLVVDNSLGDLFTASSSGLTRFTIAQNGNVRIGERNDATNISTKPYSALEVLSTRNVFDGMTDNSNYHLMLWNTDGNTGAGTGIAFANTADSTNIGASILFERTGAQSQGELQFYTKASTTQGVEPVLAMSITNAQDVDINGNLTIDIDSTASTFAICHATNGTATEQTLTDCNGSATDIAELYPSVEDAEPGDLMTLVATTSGSQKYKAIKSSSPNDQNLIGVVSTIPTGPNGDPMGDTTIPDEEYPQAIGIAGRVVIKVSLENGIIEANDYLTSSSIPGVAMKATKEGRVIGRALEKYDGSLQVSEGSRLQEHFRAQANITTGSEPKDPPTGIGKILMTTTPTWYNPAIYLTSTGNISIFEKEDAPQLDPASTYGVNMPDGSEVIRTGVFSDAVIGNLRTGSLDVMNLSLGGTNLNDRLLGLEGIASASAGFASPFAELQTKVLSLQDRVASLEASLTLLNSASGSALFTGGFDDFTASTGAELSLDSLEVNGGILADNLSILGYTTMNELSVTGSIRTGVLTIKGQSNGGASISTLNGDLRLQDQGFGGIDILDGKITIDTSGNIETTGTITAKKLNIDESNTLSASVGQGTIPLNGTNSIIYTTAVTSDSHIFITPRTKTNLQISVTTQTAGTSFKVEITSPALQPIKFDWWIVN